jgi:clan AA aspartic protease (TIGR02281 family)
MRYASGIHLLANGLLVTMSMILLTGIGNAQELNSQVSEAALFFNQLAKTSSNPVISNMARDTLNRLEHQDGPPRTQVVVPLLEQSDASLVVPTLVNDKIMGTFIVDTGASYTVITPAMAERLEVRITPETPRVSMITANGHIRAPLVTLRNITIGELRVPSVQAVVQPIGNGDDVLLSGLLGMNFFSGMELTVKQDRLIIGVQRVSKAAAEY